MNKNKKIVFGLFLIFSISAMSNEVTDSNWKQQLKNQGINYQDQSYCYIDEDGKTQGVNVDMHIRLASVSKLVTSLWATNKLGLDYKYNTKLYIKGNRLHIQGSYDPYLGNEKMFYLISQLNEQGFNKFESVTFDSNLLINPDVQYEQDSYPVMNGQIISRYLKMYFNTKNWNQDTKNEYANYYTLGKEGVFRKNVEFEISDAKLVESNPLLLEENVKVLTLSSPKVYKYLKQMNIKSNNYMAETFFRQLGGVSEFKNFLQENYKITTDQMQFFTGSGLPFIVDGVRKDNYSTCSTILTLIENMKKNVEKQNMSLEDIIAVPGSDGGTFRNRIFGTDLKNSFVAKTGTLMHTSTLAGAMNTRKGFSFFGIFNQSTDISGSKIVQNSMVKSIIDEMGGPLAFNYEVEGFHGYPNEMLKDFNTSSDEFSSIDGKLQ